MDSSKLPIHIGIIMDGNGRWASKRGLPRYAGHTAGAVTFYKTVQNCSDMGIKYLSVYAFSTENWKRSAKEIAAIMKVLEKYLDDFDKYSKMNIKPNFIGDLSVFDQRIINKIEKVRQLGKDATGMVLNIAINYGGQNEIVNATKSIVKQALNNKIDINDIDEKIFTNYLYTSGQPDVDLIIRPSGEYRLSNFLIWQSAYAEYVFMDVLWPDFDKKHLIQALEQYSNRNRRFGG
jgi:undecaprenyl diphosphate synthase